MPLELLPEEKSMDTEQKLLTETEVAKLLGLSPRTLQAWRYRGGHTPPFIKVGRSVRYRRADVLSWLRERQRRSTSDTGLPDRRVPERNR